jgi:hypothetical protein
MIEKLVQSLQESIKNRNTSNDYDVTTPKDVAIIHRGYIKNAAFPLKYDFIPKEKKSSKNEGDHVYKFGGSKKGGVVHIEHKVNKNQESGHETTSIIKTEINGMDRNIDLVRTIIPAVMHHIKSHNPDIIKLDKSFKYRTILLKRLDPEKKKYDIKKNQNGITLKVKTPLDEKSVRIIKHIKTKLTINTNKEK